MHHPWRTPSPKQIYPPPPPASPRSPHQIHVFFIVTPWWILFFLSPRHPFFPTPCSLPLPNQMQLFTQCNYTHIMPILLQACFVTHCSPLPQACLSQRSEMMLSTAKFESFFGIFNLRGCTLVTVLCTTVFCHAFRRHLFSSWLLPARGVIRQAFSRTLQPWSPIFCLCSLQTLDCYMMRLYAMLQLSTTDCTSFSLVPQCDRSHALIYAPLVCWSGCTYTCTDGPCQVSSNNLAIFNEKNCTVLWTTSHFIHFIMSFWPKIEQQGCFGGYLTFSLLRMPDFSAM